jgi:hypothetical protein
MRLPGLALALVAGTLLCACFEPAAQAQNAGAVKANSKQQIQALIADKSNWTPVQRKLDSQLIYGAREKLTGKAHPAVPTLHSGLKPEIDGRIKVDIRGKVTANLLAAIKAAGGDVLSSFPGPGIIYAVLPLANIEPLAARDDVVFIRPFLNPLHNTYEMYGDYTHQAIYARELLGVTGAGVTVGVLSGSLNDSYNSLATAFSNGVLNASNTFWISGQENSTNSFDDDGEGLAMCEIVHVLAPGARIGFATGGNSEASMASNILALADQGCRVIIDDIVYPDESPFQDGPLAQAVDTVTAQGVLYFAAAGNYGNMALGTAATWEGDFDSGGSVFTNGSKFSTNSGQYLGKYHIFAPTNGDANEITGGSGGSANLFWSDPLGAATNDYDLYLLNSESDIIGASTTVQNGTQDPFEIVGPTTNSANYLVVVLYSGTNRFLHLDYRPTVPTGILEFSTTGSTRGHNACDATNSFCVAATPAYTAQPNGDTTYPAGPYPNRFNGANQIEYFVSDGPRRMFYHPDGTPITPGNFSSSGGTVLQKPDFTAADGVYTTVPAVGESSPFYGTSAAAPHAGAIAALVWSYNPSLTPSQVRQVLMSSCVSIMGPGWNPSSGTGILMAWAAVQYALSPGALVQNGGFETGDPSYWTVSGNIENCSVTTNYAHSGAYGADLAPAGSLGYASQTLSTSPGQKYLLSLWLNCDGITPNQFQVSWNGSSLFDQTDLPNLGWTNLQFVVAATSASTVLQFGFRDDDSHLGLDEISVTPGPALAMSINPNETVALSWASMAGQNYQVQYTTNLLQTNWINLGSTLTATNQTMLATEAASTNLQRFYRVVLSP